MCMNGPSKDRGVEVSPSELRRGLSSKSKACRREKEPLDASVGSSAEEERLSSRRFEKCKETRKARTRSVFPSSKSRSRCASQPTTGKAPGAHDPSGTCRTCYIRYRHICMPPTIFSNHEIERFPQPIGRVEPVSGPGTPCNNLQVLCMPPILPRSPCAFLSTVPHLFVSATSRGIKALKVWSSCSCGCSSSVQYTISVANQCTVE